MVGMAQCLPPSRLNVIVNTADDAVFHGLHVSPDLDTMMYTLAGMANRKTGWGIDQDTFYALSFLERYGEETWFRLGDRDLGTHILRTKLLREGKTLTEITSSMVQKLGVKVTLLPMTDGRVETLIQLNGKWVPFQEYFVKGERRGLITGVRLKGVGKAAPTPQVVRAVSKADLIVIVPSNPIVSILPIFSLPGFKDLLRKTKAFKVAVSPFVGDQAFSGPAKELMEAMGYEGSSSGLAKFYSGLIDLLVIDRQDVERRREIEALGVDVRVTSTVMNTLAEKVRLAREVLNLMAHR